MLSSLVIDRHVDYLSFDMDRRTEGWTGAEFTLQALTTNTAQTSLIDKTSVASTEDTTGRGKLVIALNTAVVPIAPNRVSNYDGYDFAFPDDRPGVRRGYRYVLDAAEKYGVPIALTRAAKRKMGIPQSKVFYPYASMVRVRDIALLKNAGYKALYAYQAYDNWFCCGVDWDAPDTIPDYVRIGAISIESMA